MSMLNIDNTSLNGDITLEKLSQLCEDSSLLDSSSYFINCMQCYVYNSTELIIPYEDISVNFKLKQTYITDHKQHFIKDQVIKLCLSNEAEIHNNYTNNIIDNETAYRIIDISSYLNEEEHEMNYVYVLDGIFDLYKLNNKMYHNNAAYVQDDNYITALNTSTPYIVKLCPVHLRAAQYLLRVDSFYDIVVVSPSELITSSIYVNPVNPTI